MLAKRVIICLTFDNGILMRTKRFVSDYRYSQSFCVAPDADELMLLDITRSGPSPDFPDLVARYCQRLDLPSSAGGNVRTWEYARTLLNSGCEKVVIGYGGKEIYEEVAGKVGSQSLVAGIDSSGRNSAGAFREAAALGAGELLLTSVARDGSLGGYDLSMVRRAVSEVAVPVVVAGGCGSWSHMRQAFEAGAQGAVTTCIMHLNETAMRACKQWLAQNYSGPIRPAEAA